MPVKIVLSETKPRDGELNVNNLIEIKSDYIANVKLGVLNNRTPVIKTYSFTFRKEEVTSLLLQAIEKKGDIRLHIGIHPNLPSCENEDYSNRLTILALVSKDSNSDYDQEGDWVLIPGFNSYPGKNAFPDCCGSMNPPGGQ